MSREEARKLLGGYATGSLTDAERKALFEAALEDQDLFDELAGEQVLKDVLDEPGARQRLIAALEPPRHRAWLWAWAGAAAALAIVIGIVVSQRTPPAPQQIAQVLRSPEPEPEVAPAAPPVPRPAVRKVSPPAPPPEPPAETKAEPKKEEAVAEQLQQAKPQGDVAARGFVAAAPQAAPAPAAARLRAQNETVTVTRTIGPVEFTYSVGADGFLQIDTVEKGFISVTAESTDRDAVIFASTEEAAKTPIRIQIPANATGLIIGFSKTPGVNDSRIGSPLVPGIGFDPDPPNGRFRIQVPATSITPPSLTPATR